MIREKGNISWRKFIEYSISLLIVVLLVWYLWEQREIFLHTINLSWWHIAGISAGVLLTWYFNGLQMRVLLRHAGFRVTQCEAFSLIAATAIGNYLPMRVGTGLRLHYLKKVHNFRYVQSGSMAGVSMTLLIVSTGLMGFLGVAGMTLSGNKVDASIIILFVALSISALIMLKLPMPTFKSSNKYIARTWNEFSIGYKEMSSDPHVALKIVVLMILQFLCVGLRFYVTFDAMHLMPSTWVYLIIAPTSVLIAIASFTPGGLGFREAAIGYITLAVGYDFNSGLLAGAVDRAVLLVLTFVVGGAALLYVLTKINKVSQVKDQIKGNQL